MQFMLHVTIDLVNGSKDNIRWRAARRRERSVNIALLDLKE
jgi:hypothetical protein